MITFHSMHDIDLGGKQTCVALGRFDGIHLGHRAVIDTALQTARAKNLTCCVFTFSTPAIPLSGKANTPQLQSPAARELLLATMGVDCMACPDFDEFRHLSPHEFVRDVLHGLLRAKHLFCGENYHFGSHAAGTAADLAQLGGLYGMETATLPMVDLDGGRISSSRIRECVAGGEMAAAARMLGRPFSIDFQVATGRRLGRTLGSPTINQPLPDWFITPRFGVYATLATVGGVRHTAVTNVGLKPTVGSDGILAETYIHNFAGDLYGQAVLVEFLQFIRPEHKFDSVDLLKQQIHKDSQDAATIARNFFDGKANQ